MATGSSSTPTRARPVTSVFPGPLHRGLVAAGSRVDSPVVWLGGILVLGLLSRVAPIAASPLWVDEINQVLAAQQPLPEMLQTIRTHAGAAPLDYFGTLLAIRLVPDPVVGPRLWPLLTGIATIPAGYLAGQAWFGRTAGIYVAGAVAASPFLVYYSTEARFYSLAVLVAFLNLWALRKRNWIALSATAAVGLLTSYGFVAYLGVEMLLLAERRDIRSLAAVTAGGLVFIPWAVFALPAQGAAHYGWGTPPLLEATVFAGLGIFGLTSPLICAAVLLAIALALGVLALVSEPRNWPLAAIAVAVVAFIWYFAERSGYFWAPRHVTLALPPLVLLASAGAIRLTSRARMWVILVYSIALAPGLWFVVTSTTGLK